MSNITKFQKSIRRRLRLGERRIILILGDLVMAFIALGFGLYFWAVAVTQQLKFFDFLKLRPDWWFYLLPIIWLFLLIESYDPHRASDWRRTIRGVATAALIGIGLYMVIFFFVPGSLPRRGVFGFVVAAAALTIIWRYLYIRIFTAARFMRRVLLVGGGSTGEALLEVVAQLTPAPFYLVGIIDDDETKIGKDILGHKVIGGSDKLLEALVEQDVSDVIVAISGKLGDQMFQALLDAQEHGVEITRMPVAYEELLGRVPVQHLEADWILRSFVDEAKVGNFFETGKRLVDILGGFIGVAILILISPLIAIAIFLDDGRPIIFRQTRAGKGGDLYTIIKFRTMLIDAEKDGAQLAKEDDTRATRTGRLLRKTRLDEWPQFINVLRGEMSLVGPRPERPELMRQYQRQIPFYRGRLLAKPGITGWAQVNFKYASSLDEMVKKLEYDLYYVKRRNLFLDLIIILRTIATVVGFRGR